MVRGGVGVISNNTMLEHRRILVVDDEAAIRELVAELMADEGYVVDQAADGAAALLKVGQARPDVVVLDLMMPVMDGWTFARELHAATPGANIPIVVTSASPDLSRAAEELRPYGVRAGIAKPFDLDVLLAAIAHVARGAMAVQWPA